MPCRAVPRAHSPRRAAAAPWDGAGASRRPRAGQEGAGTGRDHGRAVPEPRREAPAPSERFVFAREIHKCLSFVSKTGDRGVSQLYANRGRESTGECTCGILPSRFQSRHPPFIQTPGHMLPCSCPIGCGARKAQPSRAAYHTSHLNLLFYPKIQKLRLVQTRVPVRSRAAWAPKQTRCPKSVETLVPISMTLTPVSSPIKSLVKA